MSAVLDLPITEIKTSNALKSLILQAIENRLHTVFFDVSWKTYLEIIEETPSRRNPKIFYNKGTLEIMPLPEHDFIARLIDSIIDLLTDVSEIDYVNYGSSTQHNETSESGFEPDSSFYFGEKAKQMRYRERFLENDPPPDLVFEVDITHSSLGKFPLLAEFGVQEIWHYADSEIQILKLENNEYLPIQTSSIFRNLAGEILDEFINTSKSLEKNEWRKLVRTWARENLKK
jgi:Uma2 family endonuclease